MLWYGVLAGVFGTLAVESAVATVIVIRKERRVESVHEQYVRECLRAEYGYSPRARRHIRKRLFPWVWKTVTEEAPMPLPLNWDGDAR